MVRHPRDYRWSSFHSNGDGKQDALITPHEQYLGLARKTGGENTTVRFSKHTLIPR